MNDAARWYESERPGLGRFFLIVARSLFQQIQPQHGLQPKSLQMIKITATSRTLPSSYPRPLSHRQHTLFIASKSFFSVRADDRTRTDDLLITNQLLYQLSYVGKKMLTTKW